MIVEMPTLNAAMQTVETMNHFEDLKSKNIGSDRSFRKSPYLLLSGHIANSLEGQIDDLVALNLRALENYRYGKPWCLPRQSRK